MDIDEGAVVLKQFDIIVTNRPGELAKVTQILANHGINIVAIASERSNKPLIRIVTNDEQTTRTALERANMKYDESELIVLQLADKPGELTKVAKRLARAGINVESIHILGKDAGITSVAMVVDNRDKAIDILH